MKGTAPVIVVAAGGTGGHIFPAIATGLKIKQIAPDATVLYACGERPLELRLYEQNGIAPHVFPARQLGSSLSSKLFNALAAGVNIARAYRWIRSVKADVVIGFGGYVAGPTVLAGRLAGCKVAIHEANSVPGKTNRMLAHFVDLTATHFDITLQSLGGKHKTVVGMPIRELNAADTKQEAREVVGLHPDKATLLVIGGSQGARHLYSALMEMLPRMDEQVTEPLQVLWSTGDNNFQELSNRYKGLALRNINVRLQPFIGDMGNALKAADLLVGRAGASAMAEAVSIGVYTIYVPLPSAIYNHQELNAREAVKTGAGEIVLEPALSDELPDRILMALRRIKADTTHSGDQGQATPNAANVLAAKILHLAKTA